jgi:CheY-like chemotaxis protein
MPSSIYKALQNAVVLCINNNQDVLECERALLETSGYTVLTAPSGSKGLELASIHLVDVVIVDYFTPGMNGLEFAIEMRRLRSQAPILMLSAAVDVPKQALRVVDAFITRERRASYSLRATARLNG